MVERKMVSMAEAEFEIFGAGGNRNFRRINLVDSVGFESGSMEGEGGRVGAARVGAPAGGAVGRVGFPRFFEIVEIFAPENAADGENGWDAGRLSVGIGDDKIPEAVFHFGSVDSSDDFVSCHFVTESGARRFSGRFEMEIGS